MTAERIKVMLKSNGETVTVSVYKREVARYLRRSPVTVVLRQVAETFLPDARRLNAQLTRIRVRVVRGVSERGKLVQHSVHARTFVVKGDRVKGYGHVEKEVDVEI